MAITAILAALTLSQSAAPAADVAYAALAAGDDRAAVAQIEGNAALDADDPARLINLGVAYARQGDRVRAREAFRQAIASEKRYDLETASGRWVESRSLAFRALAALDQGRLDSDIRTAMR